MTYTEARTFMDQHRDFAAGHTTKCPLCNGDAKVIAGFKQATRQEPVRFLGYQGLCIPCQTAFEPTSLQATMAA